jgi:nucleotide-binding universal stress UspA family protein
MKKILIALDYHPTAEIIAEHGYMLAKATGAEVVLLHVLADAVFYSSTVYDPIMGFGGYADLGIIPIEITDNLKKTSHIFLNKTKDHLADENIKTMVVEGDTADTILEAAKDLNADVIVMGSHSQKWLDHLLTGSVTEKVLQKTSTALYIIPTKK